MIHNSKTVGADGEEEAFLYLKKQGFSLIERNYRTQGGEVDLIMKDGEYTVFVEVKFRQSESYGEAVDLVPAWKQKRLIRAATSFLVEKNSYHNTYARFDIIAIFANKNDRITWIKNAFEVNYR
ncbi:MAG: YraN family protein [Coxiellaceae bacterium]|nr:YraN family protein [Coxiellaceae bacterium]